MSCQDDLTAVDLHSGVAVEVLERVSAVCSSRPLSLCRKLNSLLGTQGEGRDENLYAFIDQNKCVSSLRKLGCWIRLTFGHVA